MHPARHAGPTLRTSLCFVLLCQAALAQEVFSSNPKAEKPAIDECGPGRGEGSGPLLPCGVYRNGTGPKRQDNFMPPPDYRTPRKNRDCGPMPSSQPALKGGVSIYANAPKQIPWSSDPACHGAADWICRHDHGSFDIKCWPPGGAMAARLDGVPIPSPAQAAGKHGGGYDPCINPPAKRPPECRGGAAPARAPTPRHQAALRCAPKNLVHLKLYDEPWLRDPKRWPVLKRALEAGHAQVQSNKLARGKLMAFDEYSVTVVQMPAGYTPEQLLHEFATRFNQTLGGYGPKGDEFNTLAPFKRRVKGEPQLGELVDIKIPGNSGTVQLVEYASDHFIYQTVTSAAEGTHPVSGAREFGFRRNGSQVIFYTRAADRPYQEWQRAPGAWAQGKTWQAYTGAVAEFITRWGGVVAKASPPPYRVDVPCD